MTWGKLYKGLFVSNRWNQRCLIITNISPTMTGVFQCSCVECIYRIHRRKGLEFWSLRASQGRATGRGIPWQGVHFRTLRRYTFLECTFCYLGKVYLSKVYQSKVRKCTPCQGILGRVVLPSDTPKGEMLTRYRLANWRPVT